MTKHPTHSTSALWARFRFSVVGVLLSAPLARGELRAAIDALAAKTWTHPVTGRDVRYAAKTIERWLYRARREQDDPVGALRRAVRKDRGKVPLKPDLVERLVNQYHAYPHWTYQLHYDNLQALVKTDATLGPLRSYSTVRRYMVAQGLVRKPRPQPKKYPGELLTAGATGDPQLRDGVRRRAVALRLPSRLAAGGHAPWPVAAAAGVGHPGRSLAVLPALAVVPVRDHRGSRAWVLAGHSEVRSAPERDERQRLGDAGRGVHGGVTAARDPA